MTLLKTTLISAVAGFAIASGWHFYRQEKKAREVAQLREDNDRLRGLANAGSNTALQSPPRLHPAAKSTDAALGQKNPSASSSARTHPDGGGNEYRNEGRATPHGALQSLAWACDHADAGLVENSIVFDPKARSKATAYFASLPPETRAQWSSIEALAAAILIADHIETPFPSAPILEQADVNQISAQQVALLLPDTSRPSIEFLNTPTGWKYLITEAAVDEYLREGTQRSLKH